MKRFISMLCIAMASLLLFTACNGSKNTNQTDSSSDKVSTSADSDKNESDVQTDTESDDGVIDSGFTQEYEYNDKNQITKAYIYNSDSDLKAVVSNEYDKNDNLKTITLTDAEGKMRFFNEYEYKKDPDGNPYISKNTYFDSDEKVVLYVSYEYSEENNCPVTIGYFDGKDKKLDVEDANKIIQDLNEFMYE